MESDAQIVAPVIALVAWSMVMWCWLYATRLPALRAARIVLDPEAPRGEQMSTLPPRIRWKSDNYTHLMEQPTIFYALALSLAIIGEGSGINLQLAWAYVILRVLHSLVQTLWNKIEVRFLVFVLSNVPLFWLTANAILSITG